MLRHNDKREHGQVIILLAMALVGLFGFTALAIDGGMIYSDRRIAQNAADAAAMAGASAAAEAFMGGGTGVNYEDWNCNSVYSTANGVAKSQAISRAGSNDFSIDTDVSDKNGVTTHCGTYSNGVYEDKYYDVIVYVKVETNTAFAHFVYGGPLEGVVEATARVRPRQPVGAGNALISLTDECQGNQRGTTFGGNGDTEITGGGIWSNSCLNLNGASGWITVTDGTVNYYDTYYDHNMVITEAPTQTNTKISIPAPKVDCGTSAGSISSGVASPGNYTNIRINNSETLNLDPGLYCLSGDFVVNGGGTLIGSPDGVTIYLSNGKFSTAGTSTVQLKAPPVTCDKTSTPACPPAIPGMLIYLAEGNTNDVTLAGTEDSFYEGTVFAPSGTIDVGGNSSLLSELGANLIANNIKVHGDTDLTIKYDESVIWHTPIRTEVAQ
jgi:hypothetical protein